MEVVNIFLTNPIVEAMEDFVHQERHFRFDRLGPDGPQGRVEAPAWIFVDWVLNDLAGLEMCRRLSADPRTAKAHLTMVLESDDCQDRRRALRAGADDYMIGPIDRTRVIERVLAVDPPLRQRSASDRLELGDLAIDMTALRARWAGVPVALPTNEFRLLRFLAENPDRMLTREELIVGLGKHDPPLDARTVDVWVSRLRRALKAAGANNPLRTVRSLGYVFDTV